MAARRRSVRFGRDAANRRAAVSERSDKNNQTTDGCDRRVADRRDAVLLGYGVGAIAIVWWEAMEWVVSEDGIGGAGGLSLTYGDTIGDLVLSSTGGLVGSILAVTLLCPRRTADGSGADTDP